ncbi:hypothetical protein ASPVEDRAFT_89044 [Aspergillus versicolor CBS 583.65]|uniref:Tat pathway signal sequence n=1 Tax=Aspergillus versicolor CBS 583.65 TaxID=1036611 RepID=A0A1L9Q201_ASPVE|nr:uncharacterized protein ASPVEDRAFT_89044 [Aspergillus versicolor CBS 583.65]OJJ07805.1 hypothetical protein ASPVEDRAFT_89044 [Aspergillus versicolor CBS 583.65]
MSANYSLLHSRESQDESISDVEKSSHQSRYRFPFGKLSSRPRLWLNLWAMSNTIFSIFLVIAAFGLNYHARSLADKPVPPSSPLREDGAERFVNTQYKPNKIFQSPPSDEVDAAWNDWLRDHDHIVRVSGEKAKDLGLPEAVELYEDPGYYAYGLGVYHQMHCLSRLRKSFYPERYYPNATQHEILHHIGHCFDVLRQAILCHGDVSLVYWWNKNYTYIDEAGTRQYTQEYLQRTPEERAKGSFVTWDSEVQCRDMDAINAWAKGNAVNDDDYGGQIVD